MGMSKISINLRFSMATIFLYQLHILFGNFKNCSFPRQSTKDTGEHCWGEKFSLKGREIAQEDDSSQLLSLSYSTQEFFKAENKRCPVS